MRPPLALAAAATVALALLAGAAAGRESARPRCSPQAAVAARYVLDANRLSAVVTRVQRRALLPGSTLDPKTNRLYLVSFRLLKPNPVIGSGGGHELFAYVAWKPAAGRWCYSSGGSGP